MNGTDHLSTADAAAAVAIGGHGGTGVRPPRRPPRTAPGPASSPTPADPAAAHAPVLPRRPVPAAEVAPDATSERADEATAAPAGHAELGDQPGDQPGEPAAATEAEPAPVTGTARRGRGRPATRPANQPRRTSKARIPAPLVKTLKRRKTTAAAAGQRFVISDWVADAVAALPASPSALLRLFDTHADRLNTGLRDGDDGWHPVEFFSTGLPATTEMRIWQLIDAVYGRDDVEVRRQDIIALAIVARLEAEATANG